MKTPSPTLGEVLAQLAAPGSEAGFSLADLQAAPGGSPWFVRLFAGASAWVAAALLLAFVALSSVRDAQSLLTLGLLMCLGAVGLNRLMPRGPFQDQLALALSLAGQGLAGAGVYGLYPVEEAALLALMALTGLLLVLIAERVHRFLATVGLLTALLGLLYLQQAWEGVHLLVAGLGALAVLWGWGEAALWTAGLGEETLAPIGYGVALTLLGLLILPLTGVWLTAAWWPAAAGLAAELIVLVLWIARQAEAPLRHPRLWALLAGCAGLAVPAARMPGLLGAVLVLALGFWRGRRGLMGVAALFLAFYIGAYYYTLEWTLLVKSYALVGAGLVLLGVRLGLRWRRGGAPA